jgi:hypothetical protein
METGKEIHRVKSPTFLEMIAIIQIILFSGLGLGIALLTTKPMNQFLGYGLMSSSLFGIILLIYKKKKPDKFDIIFYENAIRFPYAFRPASNRTLKFLPYMEIIRIIRKRKWGEEYILIENIQQDQFKIPRLLENDFLPALKKKLDNRWNQIYFG